MLLLLLAACGYPTYYPNPPALLDTGTPTDTMPCGTVWAFEVVELRTTSLSGLPVDLWKVGEDCSESFVGTYPATEVLVVSAMPGEVYAAREEGGNLRGWVQIPYGQPTYAWEVR